MEYRYFKCSSNIEPIKSLSEEWSDKFEERNKKLKAIFDTMPFYDGWYGSDDFISGIICNSNNQYLEKLKQTKGYKLTLHNCQDKYIVRADKRYKVGKEFDRAICNAYQILKSYPDFSKFIVKRLGVRVMVLDSRCAYYSYAGICGEVLLIGIPVKGMRDGSDDFPIIPDYLTEIKESEFLAIQGK